MGGVAGTATVPSPASGTVFAASRVLAVAATSAVGLVAAAFAFRWAREAVHLDGARGLLWLALTAIYAPAFAAAISSRATRAERVVVVVIAGASLYALKILYDPTRLGFPDELIHATNATRVAATGELYQHNSISPVSANFPGLSAAAAGLHDLLHLGVVPSAFVVIGVARVILTIALYLLFEQITGGRDRLALEVAKARARRLAELAEKDALDLFAPPDGEEAGSRRARRPAKDASRRVSRPSG